jgi:uncharacterized protein (DUF1697 family)
MTKYVALLRGINVGGKNKVPMPALKKYLEEMGFSNVLTYIVSGNVFLESDQPADKIKDQIEKALPKVFKLDSELIKVLVLSQKQIQAIITKKPKGFGEHPEKYRYDVFFLMSIDPREAISVFDPRKGVDEIWQANGVIYSQRLIAQITKSRINKIVGNQAYKSMTGRNWNTTTRLLEILRKK